MFEDNLLVCRACGTQFDTSDRNVLKNCRICDDPRQFIPPTGQEFTTLAEMKGNYETMMAPDQTNGSIISLWTEPKFAIGQRAFLIKTPHGNVLWDLITYLSDEDIRRIDQEGGIQAIVISHPHYYTTHNLWAKTFGCPVYLAVEDREWLCREDSQGRVFIEGNEKEIIKGVTAIKVGGHFPGSLVLHWGDRLFIADSFITVPSALYHEGRLPGTASFSFMWSIPNMIPMPPQAIVNIWKALKSYKFTTTHGAFTGMDVRDSRVKARLLESAKIAIRAMGYEESQFIEELSE
ncbi:hypothetical protein C7212DRAFT_353919 [Tuber magnatum]|uniref:Metallo-beta-lactamase domain-containing protein n=1 Tax=Tuber magnatum TaxID=42249 RepID=A0A317SG11_9PEZI|nr:hypothetical protein C7212DRAFT_353919 [Tuber magnatum]